MPRETERTAAFAAPPPARPVRPVRDLPPRVSGDTDHPGQFADGGEPGSETFSTAHGGAPRSWSGNGTARRSTTPPGPAAPIWSRRQAARCAADRLGEGLPPTGRLFRGRGWATKSRARLAQFVLLGVARQRIAVDGPAVPRRTGRPWRSSVSRRSLRGDLRPDLDGDVHAGGLGAKSFQFCSNSGKTRFVHHRGRAAW